MTLFQVRFRAFSACEKRPLSGFERNFKRKNGKKIELFIVDNERETTFFEKIFKKGLAFFANLGYNNISFWSTSGSFRRFGPAIGAGLKDALMLFVPNETKTQTNNLK